MSSPSVDLPLDLIVGNVMHETWLSIAMARAAGDKRDAGVMHGLVARRLLKAIATDADVTTVLYCLAAVGAPASLDMIAEGLQAVADRQSAPPPPAAIPPLTIKPPPPPSAPPPETTS